MSTKRLSSKKVREAQSKNDVNYRNNNRDGMISLAENSHSPHGALQTDLESKMIFSIDLECQNQIVTNLAEQIE